MCRRWQRREDDLSFFFAQFSCQFSCSNLELCSTFERCSALGCSTFERCLALGCSTFRLSFWSRNDAIKQIAICEKRRPIAIAFPLKLSHAYYHPRKVVVHAHRHIYFMGQKRLYVTVWLKLLDLAVRFKFDFHKLQLSWIMFTILWLGRRWCWWWCWRYYYVHPAVVFEIPFLCINVGRCFCSSFAR